MKLLDWFTVFVFIVLVLTIVYPIENENEAPKIYCEMVKIYKQTGGEYGWPDYKETFDRECKHD